MENTRIEEISLSEFDLSLSGMHIIYMTRILQVEKSMRLHGQLQPVVARVHEGDYVEKLDFVLRMKPEEKQILPEKPVSRRDTALLIIHEVTQELVTIIQLLNL